MELWRDDVSEGLQKEFQTEVEIDGEARREEEVKKDVNETGG